MQKAYWNETATSTDPRVQPLADCHQAMTEALVKLASGNLEGLYMLLGAAGEAGRIAAERPAP